MQAMEVDRTCVEFALKKEAESDCEAGSPASKDGPGAQIITMDAEDKGGGELCEHLEF